MADVFCEEYSSTLNELIFNSKPHISMLTMLAEENSQFAPQIVKSIEAHLQKVRPEAKLPTLYLIDSIIKNVGQVYLNLFTQNLVSNFCAVFEKVDEKVRAQMYKLRQTWSDIFPNKKLYAIDVRVKELDPAWPILAQPPQQQTSIHINPKFLKSPAEDATTKTLQDLDGEVVRQKLLAKQQEMVRLQREKLELELLQTQAVVEEQKRQLFMQEQKLRSQQHQVDIQKKVSLHQLSNMSAALAVVANQNLLLETTKLKQLKVDPEAKDVLNKDQSQAVAPTAAKTAAINSKTSVNVSQTVIPSLMSVSNKTIDANPLLIQGSAKSIAIMNQPEILSNSLQASTHLVTNMSHLKSVIQQPIVGKSTLETSLHKIIGSAASNLEGKSEGVGLKTSPKMRADKNEKDKNSSSKSKSPSSKKRSVSSTFKSKEDISKPKAGDGSKACSSREPSSKVKARSKSNSLSPSKSRGTGKPKQWSPNNTSATRRTNNHSRSRSPNRREKNRDREDRGSKRERRSPRRDKENDTGSSRSKNMTSVKDSSKQNDEPPYKKSKTIDADHDEIFGGKDQDYRQMDHSGTKLSPANSSEFQGWAQYKTAMRSRESSSDYRDPFGFGKQDLDLRTNTTLPVVGKLPTPWLPYRIPKINQTKDGRMYDRPGGPAVHPRMDPRLLAQGANNYYQATRESDPSMPRALMFDRGPEIMRQADSQLRAGQLTVEQHGEIMEQLAKLYELQRMRHMQREQNMRESMMSQRSDIGQHQDVVASSPEGSPRSESEISKPEKSTKNASESQSEVEDSDRKKVEESSVKPAASKLPEDDKKSSRKPAEDEVSIVLENRREQVKEKPTIEVVISDDDDDDVKKRKPKSNSSKDGSKELGPSRSSKTVNKSMPINTVMIDDKPREVRFFGNVAIVLLENNDPREIAFRGPPQEILIGKQIVRLGFKNEKKEFEIDNAKHTICFGAPTRELFIDDVPYCAVFGGPPITVTLNGKPVELRLCGPTPEVFFGDKPRKDILPQIREMEAEEKLNAQQQQPSQKPLIAEKPLSPSGRWGGSSSKLGRDYDSRDWRFNNREEPFQRGSNSGGNRDDWPMPMSQQPRGSMSRFNDEPFRPERGVPYRDDQRGPPMLPRGPETWSRRDERGNYRGPMPAMRGDMPEPGGRHGNSSINDYYDDEGRNGPRPRPGAFYMDARYNHGGPGPIPPQMRRHPMGGMPPRFDDAGMPMRPMGPHGIGGPPHPMGPMPPAGMKYRPQFMNYPRHHEQRFGAHPEYPYLPNQQPMPAVGYNPPASIPPPQINVNELFEKLVSTGIIPHLATAVNAEQQSKPDEENDKLKVSGEKVPLIELSSDSLKIKRPVIFALLYTGIQCSTCGVRFTSEQTDKYAQHLDWHFRQNRRDKDSARKALSRKWYYDVQDWVQFEEIEDLEERARSFFEIQNNDEQGEENEDRGPSVPAGENEEDKKCAVCQELFELYWDEEHEEWHFRDALKREDKNYHPLCYEDFKVQPMLDETLRDERIEDNVQALTENENVIKAELKEPESPTKVVIAVVKEEPMEMETGNMVDQPVEDVTVKEEPMEIDESEINTKNEPGETEEPFLGVFNVLSTDYKVPPLLLWESEEPTETATAETEAVNVETIEKSDENNAPENLEENLNELKAAIDEDASETEEDETSSDEEAVDLNAVEESEENYRIITPDATNEKVEEAELPSAEIAEGDVSIGSSSPNLEDQDSIKNPEPTDEPDDTTQINIDGSIDDTVTEMSERKICENVNICDSILTKQISSEEAEIKDSKSPSPPHATESKIFGDDDVILKESSDVVSDFSFGTGLASVDDDVNLEGDASTALPLDDKCDEDSSNDDINISVDQLESVGQFDVQPAVSRGVEVSGLCSIM